MYRNIERKKKKERYIKKVYVNVSSTTKRRLFCLCQYGKKKKKVTIRFQWQRIQKWRYNSLKAVSVKKENISISNRFICIRFLKNDQLSDLYCKTFVQLLNDTTEEFLGISFFFVDLAVSLFNTFLVRTINSSVSLVRFSRLQSAKIRRLPRSE